MRPGQRHPSAALLVFTAAGAITVAGTFLPWLRTGSTSRSSYELLGLLSRLDLAPHGTVSTLVRWWPVVPLLVTAAVVAAWWQQIWVAATVALLAVLYAGGVGITLVTATRGTAVDVGAGPWVCAAGSATLLAAAAWLVLTPAIGRGPRAPASAPQAGRS